MRPAGRRPLLVLTSLAAALAGAASAEPRDPQTRRVLVRLAETLGEAHALKTVCRPDQTHWRDRLAEMISVEKPDAPLAASLAARFREGFAAARARHPRCTPQVFLEEGRVARRGRELAARLARTP